VCAHETSDLGSTWHPARSAPRGRCPRPVQRGRCAQPCAVG